MEPTDRVTIGEWVQSMADKDKEMGSQAEAHLTVLINGQLSLSICCLVTTW